MFSYFFLLCFLISWHLGAAHAPEASVSRKISYERQGKKTSFFTTYCDGAKCVRRIKETDSNGNSPKTLRYEMLRRILPGSPQPYRSEKNQIKIEELFRGLEKKHVLQNCDADQ